MWVFKKYLAVLSVVLFILLAGTSLVHAQPYPTLPGGGTTPFPTMPLCSSGQCGTVCTNGNCPYPATCSPFCNSGPPYPATCGFTCSSFQATCTAGWGGWGECVGGVQIRVCNNNPQLGQQRWCEDPNNPGNPGNPGDGEPTVAPEPTSPPPGSTATPGPSPTPVPTSTPIPIGTLQARAVRVDPSDTSCGAISGVDTGDADVDGTILGFTSNSENQPTPLVQSGANYVTFATQPGGSYTLDPLLPSADWVLAGGCWSNTDGSSGTGFNASLGDGETLTWDIGYLLGSAWVQTEGGDVYASGTIRSLLPNLTPRVFSKDGDGGNPGVVTYGTTYDFDGGSVEQGGAYVSSANWLVNATRTSVDYYDFFYNRFGRPTTTDNGLFSNLNAVSKPASRATPYYINGSITTTGDWVIADDESVIFIVTGDITIGGKVTITPGGFAAFVAQGDINISSNVGTTFNSSTSVLDGIYVTSNAGTFATGSTTAAGTARLVGKGMFVAGNFLLQRDLDTVNANTLASAELFIYDPQLLFTMPDQMKELPVVWQEVVP